MFTNRREFMKAAAALLAAAAAQQGRFAYAGDADLKQVADALLRQATDDADVPGVIATATTRDGTIYEGAFGIRKLGQDTPMTMDTVVWIASMTKALTGTAAMQMVEQGKLDLDSPASRWVPELAEVRVLTGWDNDRPITRPPKRPITLRHLLTHTAGFSYELWNTDIQKYQKVMGVPGIISCTNAALRTPLLFDPGDRWDYGINIDWAGKMVEKASGERLESYFHEHIFGPLGMTDTSFWLSPSQRTRLVAMHAREADGSLKPIDFEMPQGPEFFMGGGGL
jgi:CubicO group peptidase (beta-lactamase class C family)